MILGHRVRDQSPRCRRRHVLARDDPHDQERKHQLMGGGVGRRSGHGQGASGGLEVDSRAQCVLRAPEAQSQGRPVGQHYLLGLVRAGQPSRHHGDARRNAARWKRDKRTGREGQRRDRARRSLHPEGSAHGDLPPSRPHMFQIAERDQRARAEPDRVGAARRVDRDLMELAVRQRGRAQRVLEPAGERRDQRHGRDPDRHPDGGERRAQGPSAGPSQPDLECVSPMEARRGRHRVLVPDGVPAVV